MAKKMMKCGGYYVSRKRQRITLTNAIARADRQIAKASADLISERRKVQATAALIADLAGESDNTRRIENLSYRLMSQASTLDLAAYDLREARRARVVAVRDLAAFESGR